MKHNGFKYNKLIVLIPAIILCCLFSKNQVYAQNQVIEEIIEELANNISDEDVDYSVVTDDLANYLENPLNLNDANIESLERMHFLNEFQIDNLLNYIATNGEMKTIFELQLIEGFEMETIKKLLPFVKVSPSENQPPITFSEVLKYGNQKFSAETKFLLQNQKGFQTDSIEDNSQDASSNYQGDRMKYLIRYRFNYKTKFFAGFTAEKDPGEKIEFANHKYGFDYYSFHFQANDIGKIKSITLGDYQVKFGQGLILCTGFGLGKSSDVLNIRKKGQGIRYYSSTDENHYMRGAAATLKYGKTEFTAFISHKKIDANLSETDTLEEIEEKISTFQNTGYHRTENELENRKIIGESIGGAKAGIGFDNFKTNFNFVAYHFSLAPEQSDKPYKLFDLSEKTNYNASVDYSYFARKFSLFGETAIGKNASIAVLNGMIAHVVPQVSFSMLHRYYQKDYQAYYAASFSENSKVGNEQGLFFGLVFNPVRKLKISAYADAYEFPWLKYLVNAPSEGNEYLVQAEYTVNRNLSMYFRWKNEEKQGNLGGENAILNPVVNEKKQSFRFHLACQLSPSIGIRSRAEYVNFSKSGITEYGFIILQDINVDLSKIPLSFDIRYSIFNATFESRIYAYENDMLYNFSIPAYSGKGSRFYILAKYRFAKRMDIRIRYSQFFYPGSKSIGSSLDEISGNRKSEIKLQLLVRL